MKRPIRAGASSTNSFGLNTLTDDEAYQIHLATLEILKDTGVFVECQDARDIFGGAGALVNEETKVVKFPPYIVEDAIHSAPDTYYAYGRIPESDVVLNSSRVTFTNFGEGIMFVDPETREHRETTKADIEMAARIIDSLEHVETYERCMLSHDKHHSVQALHNAEASLTNTTKHHWLGPVDRYQCSARVFFRFRDLPVFIVFNSKQMIPARGPQTKLKENPGLSHHGDERTCPQVLLTTRNLGVPAIGSLTGNPGRQAIGSGV